MLAFTTVCNVFSAYLGIINCDEVKMYAKASQESAVLEVLKADDVVKVINKSEDAAFLQIERKGKASWVEIKLIDHKY